MRNNHHYVSVVVINDCSDDGTATRQTNRISTFTGLPTHLRVCLVLLLR